MTTTADFGSNDALLALWLTVYGLLSDPVALQLASLTRRRRGRYMDSGPLLMQILTVQLVTLTLVNVTHQRIRWNYRSSRAKATNGSARSATTYLTASSIADAGRRPAALRPTARVSRRRSGWLPAELIW